MSITVPALMSSFCHILPAICRFFRRVGAVIWRALIKYDETDGEQRAASFAYYAFFALFPLIVLLITIGTTFLGSQELAAERITEQVKAYLPVDPDSSTNVIQTINGVLKSRKSAGIIAFAVLAWSALRFFQALVHGVNKAWGTKEYSWWRMPIKNSFMLVILASALLIGYLAPTMVNQIEVFYWANYRELGISYQIFQPLIGFLRLILQQVVLFYGFWMFYKFAPRRRTTFRETWVAAMFATVGLYVLQQLFMLYTTSITNFNLLYGTFGTVLALLMWIYLSGSVIILGGCIAAAQYEISMRLTDQSEPSQARG
jgi:Ca2+-transporting ATPase